MTHVYILTITDQADFGRVKHHSVWSTHAGATNCAQAVVRSLVLKGMQDPYDLGDTYDTDICQMEVNT